MNLINKIIWLLVLSVTVSVAPVSLLAQESATAFSQSQSRPDQALIEKASEELYYEILSPFCPGRALADCPTEKASILKAKIKDELLAGKSKQTVYQDVINEFGDQFRAVPDMSGLNSLAWIIPIFTIAVGLIIVILRIRSQSSSEGIED